MTMLEFKNISKSFDDVKVLHNVDLTIEKGEVRALCGENGAGKSTLIKILAGVHRPDKTGDGYVKIDGEQVEDFSPIAAQSKGVSVMYQELDMVPTLTAVQNILLGREPRQKNKIFLDAAMAEKQVRELFERLHLSVPIDVPVRELSIAQQQIIMIAKALSFQAKILVMDEPTATLSEQDVELLFNIVKDLKKTGLSIIYISHRLEEIFEIADKVTVLRDGHIIRTENVADITKQDLIRYMVGREIIMDDEPRTEVDRKNPVLEVCGISTKQMLKDVSIKLYQGEILGIAGLVGSGRTELARAILGLDKMTGGSIILNGKPIKPSMKSAIKGHIGYVPEDRKTEGLILNMDVSRNASISTVGSLFSKAGFISNRREARAAAETLDQLSVRPKDYAMMVKNLSGGNQQKVVLGKWLLADSRILIIDEPTRGIDVGAKEEIYDLMYTLKNKGYSILMISSELPEVIRVSDRVVVMAHGKVGGILSAEELSEELIMTLAT